MIDRQIDGIETIVEKANHVVLEQIKHCDDLDFTQKASAFDYWMETYHAHKEQYGSYKHLSGAEYVAKMTQRTEWRMSKLYTKYPCLQNVH